MKTLRRRPNRKTTTGSTGMSARKLPPPATPMRRRSCAISTPLDAEGTTFAWCCCAIPRPPARPLKGPRRTIILYNGSGRDYHAYLAAGRTRQSRQGRSMRQPKEQPAGFNTGGAPDDRPGITSPEAFILVRKRGTPCKVACKINMEILAMWNKTKLQCARIA